MQEQKLEDINLEAALRRPRGVEFSVIFNNLMQVLWGDDFDDFIVKAVAARIRGTAGINPENALDVLGLLGGTYVDSIKPRISDFDDTVIFNVEFFDGSRVLIEAPRGIGSGVEVLQ